jgi:polynucleotide 5'-hydroxyl-kinase GRC3/NOL9
MNAEERRSVVVPEAWSALDFSSLVGVLLVLGAPNTGKTTFAYWLYERLAASHRPIALLDGDIGQSSLGPPTTLTLVLLSETSGADKGTETLTRWFVGDVSPRGRMLPLVVGAGRLMRRAMEAGAKTVVVDTTGLVDQAHGGVALKHALVDQLQPTTLFAFQRTRELEPILAPLRWGLRPRVMELPVAGAVRWRDVSKRQGHRADAFRRYFTGAGILRLSLRQRAIFGGCTFVPGRLLALQDADGFALALGVVVHFDEAGEELYTRTPLTDVAAVLSVQLGAIGVDLETGHEFRPGRRA